MSVELFLTDVLEALRGLLAGITKALGWTGPTVGDLADTEETKESVSECEEREM